MKIRFQSMASIVFSMLIGACSTSVPLPELYIPEPTSSVTLVNTGKRSLIREPTNIDYTAIEPLETQTTTPTDITNQAYIDTNKLIANQKRVALVIGNSDYINVARLKNPINDANAIAEVLRSRNFEVVLGTNKTKLQLDQAIAKFSSLARGADVALYYYSGHAMQVDGRNWMLPVDTQIYDKSDIAVRANPMDTVFKQMSAKAAISIIVLDACRNNPFDSQLASSSRGSSNTRGLVRPKDIRGESYLAFATAPGEVALDGYGEYSPFSEAMLQHLAVPGIELEELMRRVRKDVKTKTAGEAIPQVPWGNSSLTQKFYF